MSQDDDMEFSREQLARIKQVAALDPAIFFGDHEGMAFLKAFESRREAVIRYVLEDIVSIQDIREYCELEYEELDFLKDELNRLGKYSSPDRYSPFMLYAAMESIIRQYYEQDVNDYGHDASAKGIWGRMFNETDAMDADLVIAHHLACEIMDRLKLPHLNPKEGLRGQLAFPWAV